MPFLPINHLNLHYEIAGEHNAPTVVFLHGMGSAADDWLLQVPVFAERQRVITVDMRAHGASRDSGRAFSVELMADDVAELLMQLNEPPAHLVGLSLGGCVALTLGLQHAARVRSLTLVNTFARYQPAGRAGLRRLIQRLWLLAFAPAPEVAQFVAEGLFPKPEQKPLREAAVASLSRNPKRTYRNAMRAIAKFDLRAQLSRIACPTLIVVGDRDRTVPFAASETLLNGIPGARRLVVADSGHATPIDQPDLFNRAVLDFIERTDDGGR